MMRYVAIEVHQHMHKDDNKDFEENMDGSRLNRKERTIHLINYQLIFRRQEFVTNSLL